MSWTDVLNQVEIDTPTEKPTDLEALRQTLTISKDDNYADYGLTEDEVKQIRLEDFYSSQLNIPQQDIATSFNAEAQAFNGKREPISVQEQWDSLKDILQDSNAPMPAIAGAIIQPPQGGTAETKATEGLKDYSKLLKSYYKDGEIPKEVLQSRLGTWDYLVSSLKQVGTGINTSVLGSMSGYGRMAGEQNIIAPRSGSFGNKPPAKLTGNQFAETADELLANSNEYYGYKRNMAELMTKADMGDTAYWTNNLSNIFGFMLPAMTIQMASAGTVNAFVGNLLGGLGKTALAGKALATLTKSKVGRLLAKYAPMALQSAIPSMILGSMGALMESGTEAGLSAKEAIDNGATKEQASQIATNVWKRNVGLLAASNGVQIMLATMPFKKRIWTAFTGVVDALSEGVEELTQDNITKSELVELFPLLADKLQPAKSFIDAYDIINDKEKLQTFILSSVIGFKDFATGLVLRNHEKARQGKIPPQELFQSKVNFVMDKQAEKTRLNKMPSASKTEHEKATEKILDEHIGEGAGVDSVQDLAQDLFDNNMKYNAVVKVKKWIKEALRQGRERQDSNPDRWNPANRFENEAVAEEETTTEQPAVAETEKATGEELQQAVIEQKKLETERYEEKKKDVNLKQGINELIKYHRRNNVDLLEISGLKSMTLQALISSGEMSEDKASVLREQAGEPETKPFNEILRGGRNFIETTDTTAKYIVELTKNGDPEKEIRNVSHEIAESRFKEVGEWNASEQRFMNDEYNAMVNNNRDLYDTKYPDEKTTENNLEWLSNTAMKYALAEDVEIVYPAGTFTAKFKQVLDGIREYVKSLLKGSKEVVSMVQSGEFTQDFIEELKKGASGELPALYVENKAETEPAVVKAVEKMDDVEEAIAESPEVPEVKPSNIVDEYYNRMTKESLEDPFFSSGYEYFQDNPEAYKEVERLLQALGGDKDYIPLAIKNISEHRTSENALQYLIKQATEVTREYDQIEFYKKALTSLTGNKTETEQGVAEEQPNPAYKPNPKNNIVPKPKRFSSIDKSVRDNSQQAVIKGDTITVISKSGRKKVVSKDFPISKWTELLKSFGNPNYNKREFIKKLNATVVGDTVEDHALWERLIDSQIYAIDSAYDKYTKDKTEGEKSTSKGYNTTKGETEEQPNPAYKPNPKNEKKKIKKGYQEIYIRANGNQLIPVEGKKVKIPGYPDYDFFIHKDPNATDWVVIEGTTGFKLKTGSTQQKAIEATKNKIDEVGHAEFDKLIKDAILKHGKSPLYGGIENETETDRQPATEPVPTGTQAEDNGTATADREVSRERQDQSEDISNPESFAGNDNTTTELPTSNDRVERPTTVRFDGETVSEPDNIEVVRVPSGEYDNTEQESTISNYNLTDKALVELTKGQRRKINSEAKQILERGGELTEAEKLVLSQYTGEGGLSSGTKEALNQHYTDYRTIRAIYDALRNAGIPLNENTKALEPSAGSGNFVGNNPYLNWTTVDIDPTNAQILEKLYPNAKNYHTSFENFIADNFDLVVSNVPFLNERTIQGKKVRPDIKALHDFFFAHALDRAKPNGVVSFVTSDGTMDKKNEKIRKEIISKADILGAFRLPSGHFEKGSHTQVITDIIFMQKRPDGVQATGTQKEINEAFVSLGQFHDSENLKINNYYNMFPEHILGKAVEGVNKMYGGAPKVVIEGEADLSKMVIRRPNEYKTEKKKTEAVEESNIPTEHEAFLKWAGKEDKVTRIQLKVEGKEQVSDGFHDNFLEQNNKYYVLQDTVNFTDLTGIGKVYEEVTGETAEKITDLKKIVKLAENFQTTQSQQFVDDAKLLVDEYKDKYKKAPESDRAFKKFFKDHDALDYYFEYKHLFNKDFELSNVFNEQVKYSDSGKAEVSADSPLQVRAFASENNKGIINIKRGGVLKRSEVPQLLKSGYDILSYDAKNIQLQNEILYYSGNVYQKINEVNEVLDTLKNKKTVADQVIKDKLNAQILELERIKPEPATLDEINLKFNENWIFKYIKGDNTIYNITRKAGDKAGTYEYDTDGGYFGSQETAKLLKRVLNGQKLVSRPVDNPITDYEYNSRVLTAQNLLQEIFNSIKESIKANGFEKDVEYDFNALMRSYVRPDYTKAKYLIEPVLKEIYNNTLKTNNGKPITLNQNQYEWVTQALIEGKGINAHDVGLGKTFSAITLAKILKDKGIAKKPMFVVPDKTIDKWIDETKLLFPDAIIFNLGSLTKNKRLDMLDKYSISNADFTYISHEGFEKIDMNYADESRYMESIIAENIFDDSKGGQAKGKQEEKIDALRSYIKSRPRKRRLTFDKLGIDSIIVDEAHAFKNIGTSGEISKVEAGTQFSLSVDKKSNEVKLQSKRSYDMRCKTNYITEHNNGNNVFLLTATPTPNKIMEIYTMIKHLGQDILKEYNINNDLDFFRMFFVSGNVQMPDGGSKERVIKIVNVPELKTLINRFIDIRGIEEAKKYIKIPEVNNIAHFFDLSNEYENIQADLTTRLQNMPNAFERKDGDDTKMSVFTGGRLGAVDPRLYGGQHANVEVDSRTFDEENDKVEFTINRVVENFKKNPNGGQLIFLDPAGHEQAKRGVMPNNIHQEIKNELIKKGFKANEIAIISGKQITNPKTGTEPKTVNKRQKSVISDMFNEGKIKVVIGTTKSMGEGMNFNKKATDVFLIDIPYTPGEIAQRLGRAVRQGNENSEVNAHYLFTKGSYDALSFNIVKTKKGWQEALYSNEQVNEISTAEQMAEGGMPSGTAIAINLARDPIHRANLIKHFELETLKRNRDAVASGMRQVKGDSLRIKYKIKEFQEKIDSYTAKLQAIKPDMDIKNKKRRDEQYNKSRDYRQGLIDIAQWKMEDTQKQFTAKEEKYIKDKKEYQGIIAQIETFTEKYVDPNNGKYLIDESEVEAINQTVNDNITFNLQPTSRRALSYIKQFDKVNEQQKVFERYGANEYIQQAQDLKDSIVKDIERITDTKAGEDQIDYIRQVKQDANMNAYEKREMEKKPRTIKNITEDLKSIRRKFNEKGYKKGGEAIRKEIVKLQKELEPYLAMLPAEQRGKMFKRTRMLAERKTPAGQLKLLNQTIEKVEAMVDAINRQGAMNIFDNYFEYLHPKTNKKGILVNKSLTQETLERIQKIETLSMLTPEAYNKALSELEYPENPQEQIDKELLLMFGNIQDKSTSDLINSANEFEAIVKDGLEERRKIAEERARKVQELRDLVDNGVRSGKKQLSDEALKQKRKQLLTKINNGLKGYADSHIAFELLMNQLGEKVRNEFGLREHEAMTLENKIIRERRMEFNDYLRKLFKGNQFKSALAYRNFIKEVDSDIEVFQSTKEKQKLTIDDAFELVRQYNDGEVSEKFADIYLDDDVIKDINERLSALKRTQTGEINANQKYIKFTTNEYSQPKSLKLSQAQAVHYYLASFQHTYRNNMLNNGWTNESFTELENFMTDEAYQFADWILKKNKGNYKPLNDVYKGINHVDLSNTENYAKVKVDHGEKSTIVKDNLEKSMLGFRQGGKKSLSNSSLIQRVEHGHSPDQVSALDLYMQAVYEDAHYIAYAELAEDLNAVFKSKQVKEAIDSSTNEKFNKEIDTAIDNIVTGGNGWGYSKYLEKFKNFTSLYYLAWKAINFPKQLMSFGAGWGRMPTNKFIEYTAKFYNYKKFKENYKWTMEQDYIQNRMRMGFTQAQQGMYAEILNNPAYIGIAAMKLGMSFTRYGDIFPTMQTYHASYNYWMNELKGIPKAEAERRATQEAISACELTQQPMGKAGRGTIQDTFGTLGRFAQMFQSAQRIYFGNTYDALLDMANKKEGSKKQFAKMFFIYQVLMPILFMGVGDLFDALTDDDWEFEPLDYVFAIVASPLSGLFITAPVSNFVIREALGLNASSISFTGGAGGVIEAIGRAVGDITEGDWEEALLKLTKESGAGDTVKRINQIMDL